MDKFDLQRPFIWKLKNSIRFISEEVLQLSDDTGGFKIVGENVRENVQILVEESLGCYILGNINCHYSRMIRSAV